MKKAIIFLFAVIFFFAAKSQIYTPTAPTVYGTNVLRAKPLYVLHVPRSSDFSLNTVDTTPQIRIVNDSTWMYISGDWVNIQRSSGGGGGSTRFGIEDNTGVSNRAIDMDSYNLEITNVPNFLIGSKSLDNFYRDRNFFEMNPLESNKMLTAAFPNVGLDDKGVYVRHYDLVNSDGSQGQFLSEVDMLDSSNKEAYGLMRQLNQATSNVATSSSTIISNSFYSGGTTNESKILMSASLTDAEMYFHRRIASDELIVNIPTPPSGGASRVLPLSVNGNYANAAGDITASNGITGTGIVKSTSGTISYISGTSSQFVKADGSLDGSTYLTGNQSITLSGDISGTGSTAITTTIGNNKVSDAMLRQGTGLSVIGRGALSSGNVSDIIGTNNTVLRVSSSVLAFGGLKADHLNGTYTNGQFLKTDGSGNLSWDAAGGTTYTADEGLTLSGSTFKLGGTFTSNRTINADLYSLTMNGTKEGAILNVASGSGPDFGVAINASTVDGSALTVSASGIGDGIEVNASGGIGVYSTTTGTGIGVQAISTSGIAVDANSSGTAGKFSNTTTSGSTVADIIDVYRAIGTGTAGAGLGGAIKFSVNDASSVTGTMGSLAYKLTDATTAGLTSQFVLKGTRNNTLADLLTISGNGSTKLNKYGVGSFTGTAAYSLSVDASGNIIETTAGGGGGVTSVSGTTNRITSTGGTTPVIDIASTYVGQTSITTLGTIGTGTWQGTAIGDSYISSASTWNAKQAALSGTGLVKSTAGTISYITDNSSDWNTAYGWGNHASAGYVTASSTNTFTNKSGNISQWTNDANYSVVYSISNSVYVNKSGNDGTGTRQRPDLAFLTIQAAITAASSGDVVIVSPGTYNEDITLKNGVNLYFQQGAIISSTTNSGQYAIRDNSVAVTCTIDGFGEFKQSSTTGGAGGALKLSGTGSIVHVRCKYMYGADANTQTIQLESTATLYIKADMIEGRGHGINMNDNSICYWDGRLIYATSVGGSGVYLNNNSSFYARNGKIQSDGNDAAIAVNDASYCEVNSCYLLCTTYTGLDILGSSSICKLYNCIVENTSTGSFTLAINRTSTGTLEMSGTELKVASSSTYSMFVNSAATCKINTSCKANKPINGSTITFGKENLLVEGVNIAHAPLNTSSLVTGAYGGTGVNNGTKTITLGDNLTTSGAFPLTLTQTASTNVTLPTTGTLSTLTGTETLTNKTIGNTNTIISKDNLSTFQDDGDATKQMQFQLSGIATSTTRTITIPDASTTMVGTDATQTLTNKTIAAGSNTISGLTNSNLSGTAGITVANMSYAANSIAANSTGSTAAPSAITFKEVAEQTYSGTITWTGTTAPSGTETHRYRWNQIGKTVTLHITLVYQTAGSALTNVTMTLPSDVPSPIEPTGLTAADNIMYPGSCLVGAGLTSSTTGARGGIIINSSDTGYLIGITHASVGARAVWVTVTYFTN